MRHHCNECNSKIELKGGERANLRCNVCGGKTVILDEDVTLKCDLCMPCKLPDIQQRKIQANKVFDPSNKCSFSQAHGQNATWVVIPVKPRPQKTIKNLIEKDTQPKPKPKPKRKYTRENIHTKKIL